VPRLPLLQTCWLILRLLGALLSFLRELLFRLLGWFFPLNRHAVVVKGDDLSLGCLEVVEDGRREKELERVYKPNMFIVTALPLGFCLERC